MQEDKRRLAENYFRSGCNCCQAVLRAFADELELDEDVLMRLGSSFGGGMGRMRLTCGAVTGMMMVLGLKKGYTDNADKAAHYDRVQALARRFIETNGSVVCRELLSGVQTTAGPPEERTAAYYKKRPCAAYCGDAAALVEEELKRI